MSNLNAAPLVQLPLCTVFREELEEKYELSIVDPCPVCNVMVGRHNLRPVIPAPAHIQPAPLIPRTSSGSTFVRLGPSLPKWSRKEVCRPYFKRLTLLLSTLAKDIPQTEWCNVFPLIIEEPAASDWVFTNIIAIHPPLSWAQVETKFTSHFQLQDYRLTLQAEYDRCRQRSNESVQEFSDRFLVLSSQLSRADDDDQVIHHYLNGLTNNIVNKYHDSLATLQMQDVNFKVESLASVMHMCSTLDISMRNRHNSHSNPPGESSRGKSADTSDKKLKCKHHTNSISHSTADCYITKNAAAAAGASSPAAVKPPSSAKSSDNPHAHITCNKCNNKGHYANVCPTRTQPTVPPAAPAGRPGYTNPPSTTITSKSTTTTTGKPPYANAVGVVADPVVGTVTVSSVVLDRTPPLSVFSELSRGPLVVIQGSSFESMVDSGAQCSFMDQAVTSELDLAITPLAGAINLAHAGIAAERIGKTEPVTMDVLFPNYKLKLKSKAITHSFEVLPLRNNDYQIIIGMDLIPLLFPNGVPLEFLPPTRHSPPSHSAPSVASATIAAAYADDGVIITSESNVVDGLAELRTHINDSGAGCLPAGEIPIRPETFTTHDLAKAYDQCRADIAADPAIIEALQINTNITGFCNLPESMVKLEIPTDKRDGIYRKQYNIPFSLHPLTDQIIDRWYAEGRIVLAPPGCPYNNALTIAPKKDDEGKLTGIRVCLDTRPVNAVVESNDRFQIPHIRHALENFTGCSIFGEFDLSEAYLQFLMHPDSRPYTAFTWKGTQYMFVGCPFGLSTLPGHFQRIMSVLFRDMDFTFPYLDNLPFGSSSWKQHRDQALLIIHRCNQANLKIKPSSVKFGQSHIRCLGHMVSGAGIGIDPQKLESLHTWEQPMTDKQMQSFLGFINFMRQHVRHIGEITGPLEAVKNNKVIEWTPELLHCFELAKQALSRAPILQFPQFNLPFHIATDASNTGVGGVLYQPTTVDEGITANNIVGICSKKLGPSELNYSAYKKELFGIVFCLRQFHAYVWGRNDLVIYTDHKPLIHMLTSKELSSSLKQWLDVILDYQFTIEHRPGVLNTIPDTLSRIHSASYPDAWGVPASLPPSVRLGEGISISDTTEVLSVSSAGVIAHEMELRGKITPADSDKADLIVKEHLFGHFGREAIFRALLNKGYWWAGMRDEIQAVVNNCDPCTRFTVVKSGYNPAQPITAAGPWDHVQIDCSVHLPESADGYSAILHCICVYTGLTILRAVKSTSAETIARKFWKVCCVFGLPKIIQSDNGPEFVNDIIRALVKLTGIDHRLISPYNPRADGKVERSIGTTMGIVKKLLHGTSQHWPMFLPFAQLSFNNKVSLLTGATPFTLMFGRQLNEMKDYTGIEMVPISLSDWQSHQQRIASLIYPAISERVRLGKHAMIKLLNQHRRVLLTDAFPNGAVVMLIDPRRTSKFEAKYIGPYTVVRRTRSGNYSLRDATGELLDRHTPPDQLKLVSRKARPVDLQDNVYEIQSIDKHRGIAGAYEYYVKWKGYATRTWEPAASFLDDKLIKDYWKSKPQQ
jgi:hypothetical protein